MATETATTPGMRSRYRAGDVIPARELVTIKGEPLSLPDPGRLIHLQMRRFAGCPVCTLHLRSIVQRLDEIEAASIREVVVFHSTDEDLLRYESELPLDVIGDPQKRMYVEFGIEASPRALLDPRVWWPTMRAIGRSMVAIMRGAPVPPLFPKGGNTSLPADLLIDGDGRVVACKYGVHMHDQWSVDELLDHAATARGARA